MPDRLPELNPQHSVVVTLCNVLIILLSTAGGPTFYGSPFRLGVPYQDCVDTPLLEVHPPGDPRQDLLGPADTNRLRKNDVGKYEGPLGVSTPADNPPPFRSQYACEAVTHCA